MMKLTPLTFEQFKTRLEDFSIVADATSIGGAKVLREYRMGLGTDKFYAVPYRGEDSLVYPPTIRKVLEHFGITAVEWMTDQAGDGDVIGKVVPG